MELNISIISSPSISLCQAYFQFFLNYLEVKYKQNTYSVIYIETQGSCHDWKEDDDEENESADIRRVCRGGNSLQATRNFL